MRSDEAMRVEVTRGGRRESVHQVTVSVRDDAGTSALSFGDTAQRVFPRSAVKLIQALPFVESGAADAFGMSSPELSLACASHSGEEGHIALAGAMLNRAGLGEEALECGCHWPFDLPVALDLARRNGEPRALGNNCSGKHAGFLCTAVHLGEDPSGYVAAAHPVQRRVHAALEDVTGERLSEAEGGIDGCSIPTYAAPLERFAHGFARLGTGQGLSAERSRAARRLIDACMVAPWYMAGTRRCCTRLMELAPGRVLAKTGAEGVYCGAVPELGLGFALKAQDGATRAAEIAVADTLARIFERHDPGLAEAYRDMAHKPIATWHKAPIGEILPVDA